MSELVKVEQERNVLITALRRMTTAHSTVRGDLFDEAYVKAGGGYEGLQATAQVALDLIGVPEIEESLQTRIEIFLAEGKLFAGWPTPDGFTFEKIEARK